MIAALVGLSTIWQQFGIGRGPSVSSLLSASATAAWLAGGGASPSPSSPPVAAAASPSPNPPTLPPPTPTSKPTTAPAILPSIAPESTATPAQAALSATAIPAEPAYRLAFFSNRDGQSAIYLMDPDQPKDWKPIPLPENYEVTAWPSFCGHRLAFEARDRSFALPLWIYLYDLETSLLQPLAVDRDPPERLRHPGCSPSGERMVLNAYHSGDWFLSLLDLETNRIVTERPSGEYSSVGFAAWPRSEDRFLWMGVRSNGYFDINETRLRDGQEFGQAHLVAQGKYPAISPDGKRMVSFCGNLLYLCMVERSTKTIIFQIPVSYFKQVERKEAPASASWSSDGNWVYFSSSTSGSWDIYRMHPDGSMIQNLTEDWPSDELMPAAR